MFLSFPDHRFWAFTLAGLTLAAAPADGRVEPKLALDMSVLASPNPLLLSGGRRGAVMIEVAASPGITIIGPTGSTLKASGTIRNRNYTRRYGHYLLGDFRMEGRYRDSEYLTIGAAAGYGRALAIDLLTSSADAVGDPRGIRNSWFAGLDAAWRPNAYSLITPELRFERSIYSDSELLRNASALTMSLAYSRRIGPRASVGLRARDTVNAVAGMAGMNSAALYVTFNRQLGERARLLMEVGAERTGRQIERLDDGSMRRPGRALLAGRIDLCREGTEGGQGLSGCLSTTLNSEVSGFGGLRRDATISISMKRPLGEHFTAHGSSEYRHSSLVGGWTAAGPPDGEFNSATDAVRNMLMLDWNLRRDITLTGSIQYLRRQLISGRRIGAGFFGIQLRYQPRPRK
jgi:hypothetical protein